MWQRRQLNLVCDPARHQDYADMSNDPNATTFGASALRYASARARYPAALFDWIADLAPARRLAWDAGCGSGQATVDLASRFDSVIANDLSAEQIALAPSIPRIEWRVAAAHEMLLPAGGIDGLGETIERANADFVRDRTGFAIGGVPPETGSASAPACGGSISR